MSTTTFLLLFFSLLILSGLFSGSETALFSLNLVRKNRLRKHKPGKLVIKHLEKPQDLLITILVGNTLINVALGSFGTLYFDSNYGPQGALISVVITTVLLLFLGEITPKILAIHLQEHFSVSSIRVLSVFSRAIRPLVSLLRILNLLVLRLFTRPEDETEQNISREEFKSYLNSGFMAREMRRQEKDLLKRIISFSEITLSSMKIPRTEIVALEVSSSLSETLRIIKKTGVSRIPVYEKEIDSIIGVLFAKDLIPYALGLKKFPGLKKCVHSTFIVPEQKRAAVLFHEMIRRKRHLVITIDEFGSISGLVTLEDLAEQIMGEIYDEWDKRAVDVQQLPGGHSRIPASLQIKNYNEIFNEEIEDEYATTIGGFIIRHLGRIPMTGELITIAGKHFFCEETTPTKIISLIIPTDQPSSGPISAETIKGDITPANKGKQ